MIEEAKRLLSTREFWPNWTEDAASRRDLERFAVEMNALHLIEAKRERQMYHTSNLAWNLTPRKMGA